MINMKVALTNKESLSLAFDDFSEEEIVAQVAIRVGYHPAGYGMYGAKVVFDYENEDFFAVWSRGDSCD